MNNQSTKTKIKEANKVKIIRKACELFAKNGYYNTTMPEIAKAINMSVGNLYNYFKSKGELAKEIMLTTSSILASRLRRINEVELPTKEKIRELVKEFFLISLEEPEIISYFLRVYFSNRDVFENVCEGVSCVMEVITEISILLSEGIQKGDLRNQDFFTAFVCIMGPLGGLVFLNEEKVLEKDLLDYTEDIALNIWNALKI